MPGDIPTLRVLLLAIAIYFFFQLDIVSYLSPWLALPFDGIPFASKYVHDMVVKTVPEQPTRQFTRHIVAVGDLHGDLPNAERVLRFSNVIDDAGDWSGEVDFFVQTGDIIDRGDDTIELFALMDRLRGQAKASGGTVLSNLGNHEWMNAIGDWRYVYPSELQRFGSVAERQKYIATGPIGRTWAANYTTATRLPLHPSLGPPNTDYPPPLKAHIEKDENFEYETAHTADGPLSHAALSFVHGGLSPIYGSLQPYPSRINKIAKSLLHKLQHRIQPPPHPPNEYPGFPEGTTQQEAEMYGSNGPVWYRGWALEPDDKVCNDVDEVLKKTGTRRMVMGHTPDFHNIVARCDARIIIIDTGISRAYGGVLSALSIHYTLTYIDGEGNHQRWKEREIVSALYPETREVIADEEREVVGNFQP